MKEHFNVAITQSPEEKMHLALEGLHIRIEFINLSLTHIFLIAALKLCNFEMFLFYTSLNLWIRKSRESSRIQSTSFHFLVTGPDCVVFMKYIFIFNYHYDDQVVDTANNEAVFLQGRPCIELVIEHCFFIGTMHVVGGVQRLVPFAEENGKNAASIAKVFKSMFGDYFMNCYLFDKKNQIK